jgi:Lon protease-like protein
VTQAEIPLFPLNVVLFPGMRLPLHIFEERYKIMIRSCLNGDRTFGVALIESGSEVGGPANVHSIGTIARIVEVERLPEGRMNLVTIGVERFRLIERRDDLPYATGRVELLPEPVESALEPLAERAGARFRRYLSGLGVPRKQSDELVLPGDPVALSYLIAATLKVPARQRQRLLAEVSSAARLRREMALLEWSLGGPGDTNALSFSLN